MSIRWDLHREVLGGVVSAMKVILPGVGGVLLYLSLMIVTAMFLGVLGTVGVVALTVVAVWYWAEYHEAKRRDDLRKRTNGLCG